MENKEIGRWFFNSCLSPFLKTRTTLAFLHSDGNWPVSKQDLKKRFKGWYMDSPYSFNMQILSVSWPWDLFGSRFLIIFFNIIFFESNERQRFIWFSETFEWSFAVVFYKCTLFRKVRIKDFSFIFMKNW